MVSMVRELLDRKKTQGFLETRVVNDRPAEKWSCLNGLPKGQQFKNKGVPAWPARQSNNSVRF